MDNDTHLTRVGTIEDILKGNFKVRLHDTNQTALAKISGKIRMSRINILLGDKVEVKFSVYDPSTNGIIIRRL